MASVSCSAPTGGAWAVAVPDGGAPLQRDVTFGVVE
jgi:hypothetical protein